MEDAMVSASTGAMNSILKKLAALMGERYAEVTGTDKYEFILRNELQLMNTLLKQLSDKLDLNKQMKEYRNQMRELTYNIEDSLDNLMIHSVNKEGSGTIEKRVVPHEFIGQIQKLNAQVEKEDLQRMIRKTEIRTFGSCHMAREQWLSNVYDEDNRLVGMDGPREELVGQLINDEPDKLQWVCIFGAAGIGKTTLATQVYNQIKNQFHRRAFISVYQKTDISDNSRVTRVCRNILLQLKRHIPDRNLTGVVKEELSRERFMIVMDGVISAQILEDMKVFLPQDSCGSRIIVTTRTDGVAKYCRMHLSSFIYRMKPLRSPESLMLFQNIIFVPRKRSCPSALKEVREHIVEACHGMRLAITLIAGLLASKPVEMAHWSTVEKQLKSVNGNHLSMEWMRKIFEISYSDLSSDLKTCLLYLSSFPANHEIRKDRLIRRWAAEGFLPKRSVDTWWETGESYFFELIARKLIEPVHNDDLLQKKVYDDDADVLHTGCKVGESVHDFITSLSSEENFVTAGQHDVLWRPSDSRLSYEEQEEALFKEQKRCKVRTLTFDAAGFGGMPALSGFKHVRVLDLEDVEALDQKDLCSVGRLSLLRYLGLAGTKLMSLPPEITALEHLETVDLRRNVLLLSLPTFKSTKLVCLIAEKIWVSSTGMPEMQELEELLGVNMVINDVKDDGGDGLAKVVKQSKRLRRLAINIDRGTARTENVKASCWNLLGEIGNSNIQYLRLHEWVGVPHAHGPIVMGLLRNCWAQKRPCHLKEFRLTIDPIHPNVTRNMSASLVDVTHLTIIVERVDTVGLRVLGDLPNLVFLSLETRRMTERSIISKNGFRCLRVCSCCCTVGGMGLQFEAGAMTELRRLRLQFNLKETESEFGGVDLGIQFLACLVQFHATIDCGGSTAACVEAVEAAMRDQVSQNPNNPVLEIRRNGEDTMVQDTGRGKKHPSSVEDTKDMKMQWLDFN